MKNKIIRYTIIALAWIAVLYPLWMRIGSLPWIFNKSLLTNLFPLFGILAFTLLWLHSVAGAFESFLRRYINFDWFVHITASIIFWCILLHPLLLLVSLDFNISNLFFYYGVKFVLLGIIGWLLLLTYDVSKALKKHAFFNEI